MADLNVHVIPHARCDAIEGWREGSLRIRIRGVPEGGKVNQRLIGYLAECLDVAPSRISIVAGHTARHKRLQVEGMSEEEIFRKISNLAK